MMAVSTEDVTWSFKEDVMPTEADESILDEAARLTTRDRHDIYGHPALDFERTAKFWRVILGTEVTPYQFALCMMAVKMSRLIESPEHRDSLVDIAGYANCYQMVVEYEAPTKA